MAFTKQATRGRNTRTNSRSTNRNDEPVEFWANTVMVTDIQESGEPVLVRIGNGRPLSTMVPNKVTTTSDESFNEQNALSNVVIQKLHTEAENLDKGESYTMTPSTGELTIGAITLQVYRAETDPEAEAAAKSNIEDQAQAKLLQLVA